MPGASTRKRKASAPVEEEEDDSKKLSKAERRKLAIARAKASMEGDAKHVKQVLANKKKKQEKPTIIKESAESEEDEMVSPPSRKRRKMTQSPPASLQAKKPAPKRSTVPRAETTKAKRKSSTPRRLELNTKVRKQAALQNAKKWAEQDYQKLHSPKSEPPPAPAPIVARLSPPSYVPEPPKNTTSTIPSELVPPRVPTRRGRRSLPPPKSKTKSRTETYTTQVHPAQPEVVEDDVPTQDSKFTWKKGIYAVAIALIGIVLALGSTAPSNPPIPTLTKTTESDMQIQAPCFFDTIAQLDDDGNVLPACPSGEGEPCPTLGVCADGYLQECTNHHYEVSKNKTTCVYSDETKETLSNWKALLVELSTDYQCTFPFSTKVPHFRYADVVAANEDALVSNSLEVGILEDDFVMEHDETEGLQIGLPSDYDLSDSYPAWCRAGKYFKSWAEFFGTFLLVLVGHLVSSTWKTWKAHPLTCTIVAAVLYLGIKLRSFLKHRKQIAGDVGKALDLTLDLLQESPGQRHVLLHVRDDVVESIFPRRSRAKSYFIREVWPKVVRRLKGDSRVKKASHIAEGGAVQDTWQWVAATPKKRRSTLGDQ